MARRGPLTRAPGALKGGDTSEIVNNFVAVEGGTLWQKNKFSKKSLTMPKNRKGDPSGFSNTHSVVKYQKIEGEKFFIFGKISTMPKKLKGGTLWSLSTSILSQNSKKIEGGTLWGKKFPKQKSRGAEKKLKGGPLLSPGMVCYAGKQEKPFWFGSLGQMVQ